MLLSIKISNRIRGKVVDKYLDVVLNCTKVNLESLGWETKSTPKQGKIKAS